jgi:hypothetical protein
MIAVGILLILGAGVWYLTAGRLLEPQREADTGTASEDPDAAVPRISLADAKAAHDAGSAVFLDVRDANSYTQSHIQGALLIPLNELPERAGELNPSDWIIPYCT